MINLLIANVIKKFGCKITKNPTQLQIIRNNKDNMMRCTITHLSDDNDYL